MTRLIELHGGPLDGDTIIEDGGELRLSDDHEVGPIIAEDLKPGDELTFWGWAGGAGVYRLWSPAEGELVFSWEQDA